ncbi:MAG: hypothetical protein LBH16_12365 [Treponema sp.]|jgi:hypothetical protein|nr:hypothetical protein [Treponema sp.]
MHKTRTILIILLLCLPFLLYAQNDDSNNNDPSRETDWDDFQTELYSFGDQTFIISLGTVFPVLFMNKGVPIEHNFNPPVGGAGSLIYNFYLNSRFFIGGELNGIFLATIARETAYIIPLGLRAGFQFILWRFEFPITLTLGMTWHRYLDYRYFGFYMKGGGAVYYRFNPEWSFGVTGNWCWFPEIGTENRNEDVHGNIVELTLSARYHF